MPGYMWMTIIKRLLLSIGQMLFSTIKALPICIIVTFVVAVFMKHRIAKLKKLEGTSSLKIQLSQKKRLELLFLFYIVLLIQLVVIQRNFGTIRQLDCIPFNTPGGIRYIILYTVANAVIMIPLGILIPMLFQRMRKVTRIIILAFFLSLFIEILQYIFACGVSQTEDIIMNTIGAGIGYLIWAKKIEKKCKSSFTE